MGGRPARAVQEFLVHQTHLLHQHLHLLQQKFLKQQQLAWMDMIQEKQKLKVDQ